MSGDQRVFLVDGQAVYLEGGGDISEDVLQQALAQLAGRGQEAELQATQQGAVLVQGDDEGELIEEGEDEEEGVLAVLQDETGQQQTVRLTPSQAAALGIDYDELLSAAGQGAGSGEQSKEVEMEEEKPVLDEPTVQAALADQPDEAGDSKVTYTFEVVDDQDQDSAAAEGEDLLAKSRSIMVPQVRQTGGTVTALRTPAAPRRPAISQVPRSEPKTVTFAAGTVPASVVQQTPGNSSDASKSAQAIPEEEDPDVPVILTPMNGQTLPDYIEPRPGLRILVRPLKDAPGAPTPSQALGSSENPIQLVQQGNTFKSLQPLSAEQLKQIATVLQQSRLNVPGNAKNTIYDAQTNTRIVYRVVYPEDARGGRGRGVYVPRGRGRGRGRGMRGRPPGRPRKVDREELDEDWSPGLDLEKVERSKEKRLSTKTRTGRVSKPPKHMVKDYRHIHRTNLNQPDLDDSDGGYSEYEEPEDEEEVAEEIKPEETVPDDLAAAADQTSQVEEEPRPKRKIPQAVRDRFTCRTCNALCIGYVRLEAHYTKNPDHERPEYKSPKFMQKKIAGRGRGRGGVRGRGRGRGSYSSTRGGYVPVAKRPRTEDYDEGASPAALSPDQLLSALLAHSGGSIDKLCNNMAATLDRFRERVQARLTSVDTESLTGSTFVIDADRSTLIGLPAGVYMVSDEAPPTSVTSEMTADDDTNTAQQSATTTADSITSTPAGPPCKVAKMDFMEAAMMAVHGEVGEAGSSVSSAAETAADVVADPTTAATEATSNGTAQEASSDQSAMVVVPGSTGEKPSDTPDAKSAPRGAESSAVEPGVERDTAAAQDRMEVGETSTAGRPQAQSEPASAADVLDEFVGGLVDDYAFSSTASDAEVAPAGEPSDFDAGQIHIRMPDGRHLVTSSAVDEAPETASMPLLADQR